MTDWNPNYIKYYYDGIKFSEYPSKIWRIILPYAVDCKTVLDIGCGGGAHAITALALGYFVTALDIDGTPLGYLKNEAGRAVADKRLTLIKGDFCDTELASHDIAVSAYCFGKNMSGYTCIRKILDCADKLCVFVLPGTIVKNEFHSQLLPPNAVVSKPKFSDNNTLQRILDTAKERGRKVIRTDITCDFGMPYKRHDPFQAEFIARKLGITDIKTTKRHIDSIKTLKFGISWLPNIKKMTVILVFMTP